MIRQPELSLPKIDRLRHSLALLKIVNTLRAARPPELDDAEAALQRWDVECRALFEWLERRPKYRSRAF